MIFITSLYKFFNKHRIFLWSIIILIALILAFLLTKKQIIFLEIQSAIAAIFFMIILAFMLFRKVVLSLASVLPVVFGICFALVISSFFNLHVSVTAFVLGAAMTAISGGYSFYTAWNLKLNENYDESLREIVVSVSQRVLGVSLLFYFLIYSGYDDLRDIGIFVGTAVIGAAFFLVLFVPVMIQDKMKISEVKPGKRIIARMAEVPLHSSRIFNFLVFLFVFWLLFNSSGFINSLNSIPYVFVRSSHSDIFYLPALYLAFTIVLMLFLYGRMELGFIASLPVFSGWLWTLWMADIFGISFSATNILFPTLFFAFSIELSLLMMQGLVYDNKYGSGKFINGKVAVIISFLVSLIGVCTWLLADQYEIRSTVIVLTSGLVFVTIICFVIQPALFRYFTMARSGKRRVPMTLLDFFFTTLAFSVFIGGCLMMNLLLPFILIFPVGRKAKKIFMHYLMMGFCRFEVYLLANVKKKIINEGKEDFSKSALILANHQSHIDLLLLLMLHPKMIVITNNWVWNNPIYSFVIRYLDFYNISAGYEKIIEKLKEKIADGYSILVFPEGSRSEDSKITRFHKGAFVTAEQLNLEIVPILIHGAGDCMNKGENFLKSGTVTMKIFGRIKPEDNSYGTDYSARTKSVLKFFRAEYSKMVEEFGTPEYFRKKLLRNHFYKGPVLEWYSRIRTKQERNYELVNSLVSRDAAIVDVGCGYGFLSYMLGMVSDKRKVTGVDYDRGKIVSANNNALRTENINFVHADILHYQLEKTDAFVLFDVLHYFSEEKQERLLNNMISNLNDKGVIIIREAEKKLGRRHWGTIYTEMFSSFVGFNIRNNDQLFFTSTEKLKEIAEKHHLELQIIDQKWFTSNLVYVIRK